MSFAVDRRRALVAGVGRYGATELSDLRTPPHDVRALSRTLGDPDRCGFTVTELVDPDCRKLCLEIEALLNEAQRDDLVLLYFSGHGKLDTRGALHLCTGDTDLRGLSSTAVSLSWIRERIDDSRVGQVVIVLDCCYSGAARGAFKSDAVRHGLTTQMGQGRGKYLITSSTAMQLSLELAEDENSLFTKWFVDGLRTGKGDLDGDGQVTIGELFNYAREKVLGEHPGQQPESWGFEVTPGDVVIGRAGTPAPLARNESPYGSESHRVVRARLDQDRVVPFLGSGVFGTGPLSAFALCEGLARQSGLPPTERYPLATTAEHLERVFDDREALLEMFEQVIYEQTAESDGPRFCHELVLQMRAPLVVSTTYDHVLERRLVEVGRPYTLVTHVLEAANPHHAGRVLVLDVEPAAVRVQIVDADQWMPEEADRWTIYKLLGSPALNRLVAEHAPGLGFIDTTVVTETDHLKFLGRLNHQATRIPAAFSRRLMRAALLFLGYTLDVWHYRLVCNVFGRQRKSPIAVRVPTSPVEDLCWKRLNADQVLADPEEFARRACQEVN